MTTVNKIDNDGRQWFELDGTDYGTGFTFDHAIYGITDDDVILDADGCPLTEGDIRTIAIRNSID